ncbi:MAG: hypothetical protein IPH20_19170 [Bacteroidales bacterium]|nr:hypothetical protein [Bacteroidales bacterium]
MGVLTGAVCQVEFGFLQEFFEMDVINLHVAEFNFTDELVMQVTPD